MPAKIPLDDNRSLALKIRRAVFIMDKVVDRTLSEDGGLTFAQFMILMIVFRFPGVTQRAIAGHRGLTEAAVSRQAETLRRKGYLVRGRNPDRKRERTLALTPAGRRALSAAKKSVHGRLDAFFGVIGASDRKAVSRAFDRLLEALQAECDDPIFPCK